MGGVVVWVSHRTNGARCGCTLGSCGGSEGSLALCLTSSEFILLSLPSGLCIQQHVHTALGILRAPSSRLLVHVDGGVLTSRHGGDPDGGGGHSTTTILDNFKNSRRNAASVLVSTGSGWLLGRGGSGWLSSGRWPGGRASRGGYRGLAGGGSLNRGGSILSNVPGSNLDELTSLM
eukprot:TRINITY_DN10275_c0_g1_i1.p2 TRINITY_DN10275_c0_g1~~TRINITY_DN10275_c0_g1_i1.p2  ORF type:complete len:176 (+),score=7.53 TRINITY_DN10275_c0_g1_i1:250-777(+)